MSREVVIAVVPILMRDEMVRAILAGDKHQTRRPAWRYDKKKTREAMAIGAIHGLGSPREIMSRRYKTSWLMLHEWLSRPALDGEERRALLWVREAWSFQHLPRRLLWRADGDKLPEGGRWYPSIHLKRSESRLTLEVKETRLQALQDISDEDARAEGVKGGPPEFYPGAARHFFEKLWGTIHGPRSWEENPEVVPLTFRAHRANVRSLIPDGAQILTNAPIRDPGAG
jgi:hypothetical protein